MADPAHAAVSPAPVVGAQTPTREAVEPCDGRISHAHRHQAGPAALLRACGEVAGIARAVGLHHATTRARVIDAFLALHVGRSVHRVPPRGIGARASRSAVHRRRACQVVADTGRVIWRRSSRRRTRSPCSSAAAFAAWHPTRSRSGTETSRGRDFASRRRGRQGARTSTGYGGRLDRLRHLQPPVRPQPRGVQVPASGTALGAGARPPVLHRPAADLLARRSAGSTMLSRASRDRRGTRWRWRQQQRSWDVSGVLRVFGTRHDRPAGRRRHRPPRRSGVVRRRRVGQRIRRRHRDHPADRYRLVRDDAGRRDRGAAARALRRGVRVRRPHRRRRTPRPACRGRCSWRAASPVRGAERHLPLRRHLRGLSPAAPSSSATWPRWRGGATC